jgi:hypothetical protein
MDNNEQMSKGIMVISTPDFFFSEHADVVFGKHVVVHVHRLVLRIFEPGIQVPGDVLDDYLGFFFDYRFVQRDQQQSKQQQDGSDVHLLLLRLIAHFFFTTTYLFGSIPSSL